MTERTREQRNTAHEGAADPKNMKMHAIDCGLRR
jgi:hypothetical protein